MYHQYTIYLQVILRQKNFSFHIIYLSILVNAQLDLGKTCFFSFAILTHGLQIKNIEIIKKNIQKIYFHFFFQNIEKYIFLRKKMLLKQYYIGIINCFHLLKQLFLKYIFNKHGVLKLWTSSDRGATILKYNICPYLMTQTYYSVKTCKFLQNFCSVN